MNDNLKEQKVSTTVEPGASWQLNALTEALGDLTLTVNDSLSVGRGTDNDVVLGSKEVSRNHALLSVLNGELYVKDLASSNGTFINDARIESNASTLLQLNDTLSFASFGFQVLLTEIVAQDHSMMEMQNDIESLSAGVASSPVAKSSSHPSDELVAAEEHILESDFLDDSTVADTVSPSMIDSVNDDKTTLTDTVLPEAQTVNQQLVDEQSPVVKQTNIEEVLTASGSTVEDSVVETSIANTSVTDASAVAMPLEAESASEPATSISNNMTELETTIIDDIPRQPVAEDVTKKEPVIKKPVSSESATHELVATAPVTDEPLMQKRASHSESVVSPEHDKTTTTALQEEADPDILRAKQAATGQFSGTANLGAGRDLGTEGNNAMDQALTNTANAGQADKKPSGSWFIWVFIVLIIIGLALWLFNMGGA